MWKTLAFVTLSILARSQNVVVNPTSSQTIVQPSGSNLSVNRFESIRFADQFTGVTVRAQIDGAITDCGSNSCLVVIPSSMGAGAPSAVPSNVALWDMRTTGYISAIQTGFLANATLGTISSNGVLLTHNGTPATSNGTQRSSLGLALQSSRWAGTANTDTFKLQVDVSTLGGTNFSTLNVYTPSGKQIVGFNDYRTGWAPIHVSVDPNPSLDGNMVSGTVYGQRIWVGPSESPADPQPGGGSGSYVAQYIWVDSWRHKQKINASNLKVNVARNNNPDYNDTPAFGLEVNTENANTDVSTLWTPGDATLNVDSNTPLTNEKIGVLVANSNTSTAPATVAINVNTLRTNDPDGFFGWHHALWLSGARDTGINLTTKSSASYSDPETYTSTSVPSPATQNITVGSTSILHASNDLRIEDDEANGETIPSGAWTVVNSTTVSAAFAKSHVVPAASTITSCSRSNLLVTCTTFAAHGLVSGNRIQMSSVSDASFNTQLSLVQTVPTATQFTYTTGAGADGSTTGGQVVRVYSIRDIFSSAYPWQGIRAGDPEPPAPNALPGVLVGRQFRNGEDTIVLQRRVDFGFSGSFLRGTNAANTATMFMIDLTGNIRSMNGSDTPGATLLTANNGIGTDEWGLRQTATGSNLAVDVNTGSGWITGLTVQRTTGALTVGTGISSDGGGFKHKRGAVGCSTAAVAGAVCTGSSQAFSAAFPDTNYTLTCSLDSTTGTPVVSSVSKSTSAFTVTIAALTAVSATGNYDCIAVHD